VVVVSDADSDGKHITGLLLNIFHSMYPSLLKRGDFLYSMRTPIMTIYAGKVERDMYTEQEYEWYLQNAPKPTNVKWRKGLGSSKREEVKKSFGKRIVQFVEDERSDASLVKAFDKKFADQRKDWLAEYVAPAPAREASRASSASRSRRSSTRNSSRSRSRTAPAASRTSWTA
jgi:DNA topoisomerase-2